MDVQERESLVLGGMNAGTPEDWKNKWKKEN